MGLTIPHPLLPHPPWLSGALGIMCHLSPHSLQIGCGPNPLILQRKKQAKKGEMTCSLNKTHILLPLPPRSSHTTLLCPPPALLGLTSEALHRLLPLPAPLFPSLHARLGLKRSPPVIPHSFPPHPCLKV